MIFLRASAILCVLLILAACGSVVESTFTEITPAPSPETSTTPTASVICDFFAAGGPNDHFTDASIAAIESVSGVIADPSEAVATRDAIDATQELAARVSGDERDDLLTLAEATDATVISGEGYGGWVDAFDAFYVKYAEQCGQEIAN